VRLNQRCQVCADFDLCSECFAAKRHDPSHPTVEVAIASGGAQMIPPYPQRNFLGASSSSLAAAPQTQTTTTTATGGLAPSLLPTLPLAGPGIPIDDERPRRVVRPSAPHLTDPIQKMEWVLAATELGTIPLSQMSTQTATTFMHLYDAGLAAMERHKTGKSHSQIVGRIALVLAGIPRRRPGSYVVHDVGTPLEQETVSGVMASLIAQVMSLDNNGLFTMPMETADGGRGPSSERMDLSSIADNVEKGKYFKGVDSPETALALFQRHLLSVWASVQRSHPADHPVAAIASRLDKLSRNAIAEIRDALGVTSIVDLPPATVVAASSATAGDNDPPPSSSAGGGNAGGKKRQKRVVDAEEDAAETIRQLRDEVARAHQRIDSLIALLSEKMVSPLGKGLERLSRVG